MHASFTGFETAIPKPAAVLFHVAFGPPHYPPLDTLGTIFYAAFFIAISLLTMRRPAYGACAIIIVMPFALYQDTADFTITLPKVAVLAVLLGLSAYRDAFAPIAERVPWRILTAGLFVLAAMLISFVHAAHAGPVIRQCIKAAGYLLIFCAVTAAYRLDPDRRAIANASFATAIAVSLLALAQEVVGSPSALLLNGHALPRIAGPLEGPNQLAGYFDAVIPLALAFTLVERNTLARLTLFFMIFADILTFSRGGLIGAAASIATVAIAMRSQLRAAIMPILGGIAAGLAVAFSWGVVFESLGMLRWWDWQSNYAGGVGTRSELWHAAIVLWKQHPLFGVGAGNFELELPLAGVRGVRTHANSLYLQALVEGGIPLLIATLWLVYVSIATFVQERAQSPFVVAALGAGVALALHQTVDFLTFYPKVGGEWWAIMALGAAELSVVARVRQQQACV
ncbi:MAG TPA: O-antigen ligase family protein [Candidatus Baltobacteraceae bacterium]|nr:O-antigen ligase family protein [Candidatus Baltobacteraceae bacterium]